MHNNKPIILVAGVDQALIGLLFGEICDLEKEPDPADEMFDDDAESAHQLLVRRIVEAPMAVFVEAQEFDDSFYSGLTMEEYVADVESEVMENGILGSIDAVFFQAGFINSSTDPEMLNFLRSAVQFDNVLIVCNTDFPNSRKASETVSFLMGLAGMRGVCDSAAFPQGLLISTPRRLVEEAKTLAEGLFATEGERAAFASAWDDFFSGKIEDWRKLQETECAIAIEHARARAQEIVDEQETSLGEDIAEATGYIVDLFRAVNDKKDTAVVRDKAKSDKAKRQSALEFELKDNIIFLIHAVAACYGRFIPPHEVEEYLSVVPGDFPKNAAAVTYAVGTAVGMVSDIPFWGMTDYKDIFQDVMSEATEDSGPAHVDCGEIGDDADAFDGCGKQGVSDAGPEAGSENEGEAGERSSEAFFEHVTKNLKQSWAEQEKSAAGKSGGATAADAAANTAGSPTPRATAAPQVVGNVLPVFLAPVATVNPEVKPKKPGRPAKAKAGQGAKTNGVKTTGKKRTK